MSHRAFQSATAMPFHISWNGEPVVVVSGGVTTPTTAIVDRDRPVTEDRKGDGVTHMGTLIFADSISIRLDAYVTIGGEKWQIDKGRKSEDGGRLWYIEKSEKQFRTGGSGGYMGR
jgi:hypothetical protein